MTDFMKCALAGALGINAAIWLVVYVLTQQLSHL